MTVQRDVDRQCVPSQSDAGCAGNPYEAMGSADWSPSSGSDNVRTVVGSETIAVNDSDVVRLSNVPVGANHAEIHVWLSAGCGVVWTVGGVPPDQGNGVGNRTSDGGGIELESAAEIAAFQAMALSGCSGQLHVTYYTLHTHVE